MNQVGGAGYSNTIRRARRKQVCPVGSDVARQTELWYDKVGSPAFHEGGLGRVERRSTARLRKVRTMRERRCVLLIAGALAGVLLLITACTASGPTAPPVTDVVPPAATLAPAAQPAAASIRPFPKPGMSVRFDRWSLEEGLSQSVAQVLLQDRRGFIWIGTEDGLNRFDGYQFTVFRQDPDDPHSLSGNAILALGEGPNGAIWVGTFGSGLNRYDPETGQFDR